AAERLKDADRERDPLKRVAFVGVEAAGHRHNRFAGQRTAYQLPCMRWDGRMREVRQFLIGNGLAVADVFGEGTEAGPENDADGRAAIPAGPDGGGRLRDLVVKFGHEANIRERTVAGYRETPVVLLQLPWPADL